MMFLKNSGSEFRKGSKTVMNYGIHSNEYTSETLQAKMKIEIWRPQEFRKCFAFFTYSSFISKYGPYGLRFFF